MISSKFPVSGRARKPLLTSLVSLLAAIGLTGAFAASATANPISSGETSVTLRPAVAKVLKKNGVSVAPVKPASVKKGAVSFPVTGGQLDPATAKGQIRHSGGLKFSAGKLSLVARSFTIRTAAGILSGKVGKATVPLFRVDLKKAKVSRAGLGVKVRGAVLSLTGASAGALNKTFKVRLFKPGLVIGTAATTVNFASVKLAAQGSTDLTLDPDIDTYYLQTIVTTKLPAWLAQLAQIRALFDTSAPLGVTPVGHQVRFQVLDGVLQSTLDETENALESAFRGNNSVSVSR